MTTHLRITHHRRAIRKIETATSRKIPLARRQVLSAAHARHHLALFELGVAA